MGNVCSTATPTATPNDPVKPVAKPAGANGAHKPAPVSTAHLSGDELYAKVVELCKAAKTSNPDNLCAKNFDEAYYNSLPADQKEDFIKVIKSGSENADSGCGCYAMKPEDYDRFAPFLGKVVADYHKVPEGTKHVNDWSLEGAEGLPEGGKLDLAALGLPELSMRVRVGRNLKMFPLPGAMTEQDRRDMENKMCEAFKVLIDKFGGKYNSLTPDHANSITTDEYNTLVKRHFMFKDMADDPYLASAGIASHWPIGRGCYVSGDEQFIIWVGEEDHLRIMCMKKGSVLNEVFDRLRESLEVVESIEGLQFAKSETFGYITSCPTNLGTGMRASVHIQVPKLTADGTDTAAKAICKPLGLSVRGLGGEHTAIGADGTIDLSPSARFHIRECDIICALYKGISQLKAAEEEAVPAAAPAPAAPAFDAAEAARIVELCKQAKTTNPDNLCAKNFDEEYYNSLTDEQKADFVKVIKSGSENADSGCGAYAMKPEDYDRFAPFLGKVVADYHKVPEGTKHVNDWSLDGAEGLPEGGKLDLAALGLPELSMRVRVGRNLKMFPLPGAMTEQHRRDMENKMCEAFKVLIEKFGGKYNSLTPDHADSITTDEYNTLVKRHFMFKDMADDPYLASAGIASHWPIGRGCYVSGDEQFIIWVGEEDHLRIMCMKKGTVLNEVFDRLRESLDIVESIDGIEFAKSDVFGYITSCPTNLGTGMRASLHIQVPNLTADGTDAKAKAICKPLGLSVRGLGGEHTPIGADGTIDLSPSARFHIRECDIICALYKGISQLKAAEEEAAPAPAEEAAPAAEEAAPAAEEAAAPAAEEEAAPAAEEAAAPAEEEAKEE